MDAKEKEIAMFFCPDCDLEICNCVIERIRKQENAIIQAQDAIKALDALNNKLTKEKKLAIEQAEKWKEKALKREQSELNSKMDEIDHQFLKKINRDKLL